MNDEPDQTFSDSTELNQTIKEVAEMTVTQDTLDTLASRILKQTMGEPQADFRHRHLRWEHFQAPQRSKRSFWKKSVTTLRSPRYEVHPNGTENCEWPVDTRFS